MAVISRLGGFALVVAVIVIVTLLVWQRQEFFFEGRRPSPSPTMATRVDRVAWITAPGRLSAAHADLGAACSRCHVPFGRSGDAKCIDCHAKDTQLTERVSTRFHAEAKNCVACHTEHVGRSARISRMDHAVLSDTIPCTSCHVDRHREVFGSRCADCHGTERWEIAGYRHPASSSQVCSECHRPPKSHLMMHFEMVDRAVSRQRDAAVDQCWRCHTIDDWNEIKGIGRYVHH